MIFKKTYDSCSKQSQTEGPMRTETDNSPEVKSGKHFIVVNKVPLYINVIGNTTVNASGKILKVGTASFHVT